MAGFSVTVQRSIEVTVAVEAESPEAAVALVNRRDFPLPKRNEWNGLDDWSYTVHDKDGDIIYEESRWS